jgi:hypothetical protein
VEHIEIKYNQNLTPLEAVLSKVKRPGDFFVHGSIEIPMPKVGVKGAGTLSFPVPEAQIADILRVADRAPYGRGQETIVDTSVRNVWQIAAGDVQISGKSWAQNLGTILSKVSAGLGCGNAGVSAELYKLLVYDPGGFFLAHRDTEKASGMFGTLVLTLPSTHLGGELRIRHAGREVTVPASSAEPSELSFCAFYADCEHEVLPVRQGHRVCLVYNLIQRPAKGKSRSLKAPDYVTQIAEAADILDRFLKTPEAPPKIAWLLEHQYSPAGLSFLALKGADLARARVLVEASARAQLAVHLAIVHVGESGAAEPDYDDFYRSRGNRHWYNDGDEDEDEDEAGDDYEAGDGDADFSVESIDDSWKYVDQWRDADDRVVKFGRIPLDDGELLPAGALDGEPPDVKRLTEASGNEGATFERSYRRAALVLWREDKTADVLLQSGVVAALPYLKRLATGGKRTRVAAMGVAERVLEAWPGDAHGWNWHSIEVASPGSAERIAMIELLGRLGAEPLLDRFLRGTVTSSYDGSEKTALLASVNLLGKTKAAAVLSILMSARMPERPGECAELLLALSENTSLRFLQVAEAAVAALDGIGTCVSNPHAFRREQEEHRRPGPQFLVNLLGALRCFSGGGTLCLAAAEKIASRTDTFSPVTLVVPALQAMVGRSSGRNPTGNGDTAYLWNSAAEFLLQLSEAPPQPPSDWCLKAKLSCSCPYCRELLAFANDPVLRTHRFRVNKERRGHLHNAIDRARLEMTHVTERVGSPQTLVCTKDRRSFNQRMKQYRDEIAAMRTLLGLVPQSGGSAGLLSNRARLDRTVAPGAVAETVATAGREVRALATRMELAVSRAGAVAD